MPRYQPIGQNQAIAFMQASVDAARLLTCRAARMAQREVLRPRGGSIYKLVAGETAVRVTEQAMQILDGNG